MGATRLAGADRTGVRTRPTKLAGSAARSSAVQQAQTSGLAVAVRRSTLRTAAEQFSVGRSRGHRARSRVGRFPAAELWSQAVVRRGLMTERQSRAPSTPAGLLATEELHRVSTAPPRTMVALSLEGTPRPPAQARRQVEPARRADRIHSAAPPGSQARRWRRSWCSGSSRRDRSAAPHPGRKIGADGGAARRSSACARPGRRIHRARLWPRTCLARTAAIHPWRRLRLPLFHLAIRVRSADRASERRSAATRSAAPTHAMTPAIRSRSR